MKIRSILHEPAIILALTIVACIAISGAFSAVVTTWTAQSWYFNRQASEGPDLIKRVELSWSSDAASDGFSADVSHEMHGWVGGVKFIPDGDVTALYDVTLEDEDGDDLLQGKGANLSLTQAPYGFRSSAMPVAGVTTLTVDNTTGTGVIVVFITP